MIHKLCVIMENAGITNPDSADGISVCMSCPLNKCEFDNTYRSTQLSNNIKKTKELYLEGVKVAEIAVIMGKCRRTIDRYIHDYT